MGRAGRSPVRGQRVVGILTTLYLGRREAWNKVLSCFRSTCTSHLLSISVIFEIFNVNLTFLKIIFRNDSIGFWVSTACIFRMVFVVSDETERNRVHFDLARPEFQR